MFTTPATTIERRGDEPDGRNHAFASPATAPVTERKSASSLREAQGSASHVCEMRRRAKASLNHTAQPKPIGGENAQRSSMSFEQRSQALRHLRRKVWPHPALLLANRPLFKEVRRSIQDASRGRSQIFTLDSGCLTRGCSDNSAASSRSSSFWSKEVAQ